MKLSASSVAVALGAGFLAACDSKNSASNSANADSAANSSTNSSANPTNANSTTNFAANFAPPAMPRRNLGDLSVSALAFGCMGLSYHRSVKLDKKDAAEILSRAIDYGITLFDTAEVYGPRSNELLVGEILAPYKNKVLLSTKFGFTPDGKGLDSSEKRIREVVEGSLKRLKLDKIELLYQHRFDPKVAPEQVAATVAALIKEGKVGRFGLSEVSADYIRRANAVCKVTALQSEYHLMHREVESKIFPTLDELDIAFIAYSPLNRGYLTGKLTKNSSFDKANDNRATFPRFTDEAMRANYVIIELLREFGGELNATPAQIAIAYLMAKSSRVIPLFGASKIVHLQENLGALRVLAEPKFAQILPNLEARLNEIKIVGERYPAEQQKRVGG